MFESVVPHKGQEFLNNSEWLTYLGVVAVSIWGGIVNYMNSKTKFTWASLFAQISSSSFAGLMAGFACQYANIAGPLMFVLVGVSAHMGTPALIKIAKKFKVVRDLLDEKGLTE